MPPTPPAAAKGAEPAEKAPEKAASAGGIKPWLPVIANVVLMPVLAYATVTFLLLPRMQPKGGAMAVNARTAGSGETPRGAGHSKITVPLSSKVLVNVAGTMGTRYLVASIVLVGSDPELPALVEKNDAELRDAAAGALSIKTIADLERPDVRNLIRTELMSIFNNVLGSGVVTEIYLTEFAIQ